MRELIAKIMVATKEDIPIENKRRNRFMLPSKF